MPDPVATATTDLRYPLGKFTAPEVITPAMIAQWIDHIAAAPAQIRDAVSGLSDAQLDTPYRPGGWTIRQLVHHLADSHMNAYIRFKLALTEDNPVITPYSQADWANLADSRLPIASSLNLMDALHLRMVALLQSAPPEQWSRTFRHPELGNRRIDDTVGLYAWHGQHHTAHINGLRTREGW